MLASPFTYQRMNSLLSRSTDVISFCGNTGPLSARIVDPQQVAVQSHSSLPQRPDTVCCMHIARTCA